MITFTNRKLVTIVTESVLERSLVARLKELGAKGYTSMPVAGEGHRGARSGADPLGDNLRIEVVCSEEVAERIVEAVVAEFYDNYAMVLFVSDVQVVRPQKF